MQVKIYDVAEDRFGAALRTFRAQCDLAECFPDDPDGLEDARTMIETTGAAVVGGGAAPIVVLERA